MERKGLTRPVQPGVAQVGGETAGLLMPAAAAAKATDAVGGLLGLLSNVGVTGKMRPDHARSSVNIFEPKHVQQRAFDVDYPQGAQGPAGSRLAFDIDGRPLSAEYIAGRRVVGGVDEGLSAGDAYRIADALGAPVVATSKQSKDLNKAAGRYHGGPDRRIFIDKSLDPKRGGRVLQHEVGHLVDDLAMGVVGPKGSRIPIEGLDKELRLVYSDLNSAGYVPKGKIGAKPETSGYPTHEVGAELMAEAIRAYARDPNYLKTVAPNTAARIREYVNANPNLKKVIQFNSAAGLFGVALPSADWGNE